MIAIAAVNNNVKMIKVGLGHGANPGNIISSYDTTDLILAAYLRHLETVQTLIDGGTSLKHVNNLG
jgi:ankyrin repeat protein